MNEKQVCARTGLGSETLLRLHRLRVIPAWASLARPQRGKWRIFGAESTLLCRIAAIFLALGARNAAEAAGLLAHLEALPISERDAFLTGAVVARYPGGRIEWASSAAALPRSDRLKPEVVIGLAEALAENRETARL
jgi:hypothetical protein